MCGICGRYDFDATATVPRDYIRAMRDTMVHRGPDDAGEYCAANFAMGVRRLSIIDPEGGHQPIANEDGSVWAVLNGEIYNFPELRRHLAAKGHVFRTQTDTEVIPHAFEQYGPDCVHRLNGMFAIAIWDNRDRRLLLFRDRFGIKPLYYHRSEEFFLFASEMRALLRDRRVPRRMRCQGVLDFLHLGCVCAPDTILEGIRKLPAAHALEIRNGQVRTWRYWDLASARDSVNGRAVPREKVAALLSDSVRLRLRADVPLGVFLSGGLDSAGIASMASGNGRAVQAFTAGFAVRSYDETAVASRTAAFCGAAHHVEMVQPDAVRALGRIVEHLEEPMADPAAIPLYYLCGLAEGRATVLLVGDGGDELFGGYDRYYWDGWAQALGAVPAFLRKRAVAWPAELIGGRRSALARRVRKLAETAGRPFADRYFAWHSMLSPDLHDGLLSGSLRSPAVSETGRAFLRLAREARTTDRLRQMQYVDIHTMLTERLLLKADKLGMARSLELRVPYLDHRLAAYAYGLPRHLKVSNTRMKCVLKDALAGRVPGSILGARKKGFRVPLARWFQGRFSGFARELLAEDEVRKLGVLNPATVQRLLSGLLDGDDSLERIVYALMVLRLWHARFVEGRSA